MKWLIVGFVCLVLSNYSKAKQCISCIPMERADFQGQPNSSAVNVQHKTFKQRSQQQNSQLLPASQAKPQQYWSTSRTLNIQNRQMSAGFQSQQGQQLQDQQQKQTFTGFGQDFNKALASGNGGSQQNHVSSQQGQSNQNQQQEQAFDDLGQGFSNSPGGGDLGQGFCQGCECFNSNNNQFIFNSCNQFEQPICNQLGQIKCIPRLGSCTSPPFFQFPSCSFFPCQNQTVQCPKAHACISDVCKPCRPHFYDVLWNEICKT